MQNDAKNAPKREGRPHTGAQLIHQLSHSMPHHGITQKSCCRNSTFEQDGQDFGASGDRILPTVILYNPSRMEPKAYMFRSKP